MWILISNDDYQVLLTVLIDASNPLPNDSKRKEVLNNLRYKLNSYCRTVEHPGYIKQDVWEDLVAKAISRGKPNIPRENLDPWGNPVDTRGF